MTVTHLLDLAPGPENPRNSEGAFARLPTGRILFAYRRFMEKGGEDNGRSDIALSRSASARSYSPVRLSVIAR